MPTRDGKVSRQTKADIIALKKKFVEYYRDVPVQKYACMAIGRTEECVINWKREDPEFLNAVLEAESEWVKKNVLAAKAEFQLERMRKEIFAQQTDHTSGGEKIQVIPILSGASTVEKPELSTETPAEPE